MLSYMVEVGLRSWGHLAAAAPLAAGLYLGGCTPAQVAAGAAVSVLVDADHLADHLLLTRGSLNPRRFFASYHGHQTQHLLLALHSWELALLCGALIWAWLGAGWAAALAGGWLYHLALDQAANRVGWPFYLLAFRASRGFLRSRLPCPQAGQDKGGGSIPPP